MDTAGTGDLPELGLPRVVVPLQPILEVDGITLALITVELWDHATFLRLAAVPGERAFAMLEASRRALADWVRRSQDEPGRHEPPQPQRLAEIFHCDELAVRDDQGRDSLLSSAGYGGSDREWHVDWAFSPPVPRTSAWMEITGQHSGQALACRVPLA